MQKMSTAVFFVYLHLSVGPMQLQYWRYTSCTLISQKSEPQVLGNSHTNWRNILKLSLSLQSYVELFSFHMKQIHTEAHHSTLTPFLTLKKHTQITWSESFPPTQPISPNPSRSDWKRMLAACRLKCTVLVAFNVSFFSGCRHCLRRRRTSSMHRLQKRCFGLETIRLWKCSEYWMPESS